MRINPSVTARFIGDGARMLHALEPDTGAYFYFEGSEGLPLDHFAVTIEGSREEIWEPPCRSAPARRSTSTSSSRTCTRSTTRSPRSTAT